MKKTLLMLLMSMGLFANTQPYKKEIILEKISKPTLVQVALDNEIYKHTASDYRDIRVQSANGIKGYAIKSLSKKHIVNQKTLTASSYDRENAKLTYKFKQAFEIEKLELNIEDRNFESSIDVYVNGKLLLQNQKIFDYSNETGIRNFTIKIAKVLAKEVSLVYHLDKTTSFYKKYQHIRKRSQYLSIKSLRFSNTNSSKELWNKTTIALKEHTLDAQKKQSSYIFQSEHIPFSKIAIELKDKNFKRSGRIYASQDAKTWHQIQRFSISKSSLKHTNNTEIICSSRSKYLKIIMDNADNQALNIDAVRLFTTPSYLYFIANSNEQYALYFGDMNLTKPSYEIASLIGNTDASMKATLSTLEKLKVEKVVVAEVSFFKTHQEQMFILGMLLALAVLGYVAFGLLKRV